MEKYGWWVVGGAVSMPALAAPILASFGLLHWWVAVVLGAYFIYFLVVGVNIVVEGQEE